MSVVEEVEGAEVVGGGGGADAVDGVEDVIVVGGGPVGLWLAAELRLGGASVTVLEARTVRSPHSRALTIHPRTIENLAFRGVAGPFLAEGGRIPRGHFGGLEALLDFSVLDTPYPFTLALPQARTEELLEDHARAAGVRILRGHRVTGLSQGAGSDSVTVRVEGAEGVGGAAAAGGGEAGVGAYALAGRYVVGCDGTRSTVRAAAGIGFPGTDATVWGWLGDVVLDDPPPGAGLLNLSGPEGGLLVVPLGGGPHRFVGITPEDIGAAPDGPPVLAELRAKVTRIAGRDFGMRDPAWLSRFGNATRQAARYRAGRVLLAGDAAHMHFPAGGVGLNVGIQDATNLGWKLAAVVRGAASPGLLDSYHAERHPVGAELLESTRAQTALMLGFSPEGQALRAFLSGRIAGVPEFSRDLAERLSGLSVAYPPAPGSGAHPLTGRRAPDLALEPAPPGGPDAGSPDAGSPDSGSPAAGSPSAGATTLFGLLRDGRHVLLLGGGGGAGEEGHGPAEVPDGTVVRRARLVSSHPGWSGVRSVLVRPDGHVAWAYGEDRPPARR
ncbi:FAD-dependent monooxygenase [Streptomyces sp. NPDC093085]|uniref:FAD-dependent monooxygenase n=1 Tax=Streptomyces sp. NPDC093085 TaxID=3155068 RepID=UPI003437AF62